MAFEAGMPLSSNLRSGHVHLYQDEPVTSFGTQSAIDFFHLSIGIEITEDISMINYAQRATALERI